MTAIQWLTTNPSGRAHTHGADDGQTGWRTHAVEADDAETFPAIAGRAAACGLVPRHGWNIDLFIHRKCARCVKRLAAAARPVPDGGDAMSERESPEKIVAAAPSSPASVAAPSPFMLSVPAPTTPISPPRPLYRQVPVCPDHEAIETCPACALAEARREARLREALASAIEHFIHFTGRRWHCGLCDVTWVANQEQEHHREDCSIVAWRAALASPSPDDQQETAT